ncbi:phospholipase D-like domain-containing protein [Alteromonas sp. McT4-15]|uniref:phospholipase D-like domain-containing protein n=1 Tax=Alteromonas sp. McT4-15 TaxID=2881256 RepID=UPI001CF8DE3C|nr:phospholipase D-like domain-containing protein [Alteromonas sp. McT4-15]MCB4438264.1 phospholipase D-like domain-containing protein [Alteromonas sp. McT4-15]
MAIVTALTQGLTPNNDHEFEVNKLLALPWASQFFISVAFVKETGIAKIAAALQEKNDVSQIFVGICNGITSKQALAKLLSIGVQPYVVDMGTQSSIFHPKLYGAIGDQKATFIVGSANLTASGLGDNVEVSSKIELDLSDKSDSEFASDLVTPFQNLIGQFPQNVFQVTDDALIDDLFNDGRLEDENIKRSASVSGSKSPSGKSVAIPALPLHRRKPPSLPKPAPVQVAPSPAQSSAITPASGLVWSSKELTERDLCIPTGGKTNPTGSMILKKGLLEGIDQRHYFKNNVFVGLNWSPDPSPSKRHLLRATANFEIVINGISNGNFDLRLTHNSKTNTKTYAQKNAMTQIHWGEAKPIVAKRGLLGKHMSLYHLGGNRFQIEIT